MGTVCVVHCIVVVQVDNRNHSLVPKPLCMSWIGKSQRHVTRSTFSAEPLAAGDAADQGIWIAHMLCELEHGPMTAHEVKNRRMELCN